MIMTTQPCGQIYKPLHIGDDVAGRTGGDLFYGASSNGMISYLEFIRLWLACAVESLTGNVTKYLRAFEVKALQEAADIASGKTRAPALIPDSARAAEAPTIMLNRSAKRILARGLPASRQYGWFRFASPRTLTGNQFFELVAKLSVNGRMGVYSLEYKTRLCCRRPVNTTLSASPSLANRASINLGYCAAHLWPN